MTKSRKISLSDIDVVVLCGGLGTRLRSVLPDAPKALAPIGEKPFFDMFLAPFIRAGFKRFILCVGHKQDQIREYIKNKKIINGDISFVFSEEQSPLGTGGAIKHAYVHIASENFLVVNGDTFYDFDFQKFVAEHASRRSLITMGLVPAERSDGGSVATNDALRVVGFSEKQTYQKGGYMNAGVYGMRRDIVSYMPAGPEFSLEYDFFPQLVSQNKCAGFLVEGMVYDIGTVERYASAVPVITTKYA